MNLPLWSYRLSPSDFSLKEQFGVMSVLNVILTGLQSYSYFPLLWLKDFIDRVAGLPFLHWAYQMTKHGWRLQKFSADLALHYPAQVV